MTSRPTGSCPGRPISFSRCGNARPEIALAMREADSAPPDREQLAVRLVGLAAVLLIGVQILAQGYLPVDDALRHAGKAIAGKPWEAIVVAGPGVIDFSPGWHAFLRGVHLATGANA